jgi:hypothetical protein
MTFRRTFGRLSGGKFPFLMATITRFPRRAVYEMKFASDRTMTKSPGRRFMLSGRVGHQVWPRTWLPSAWISASGTEPGTMLSSPRRNGLPSSAKVRFQKSTASRTAAIRGSASAETTVILGVFVQRTVWGRTTSVAAIAHAATPATNMPKPILTWLWLMALHSQETNQWLHRSAEAGVGVAFDPSLSVSVALQYLQ